MQYFEIFGNRGLYYDGWFAGTIHKAPWEVKPRCTLENDVWELYNVAEDFSMSNNLADKYPEKLKELQEMFIQEGEKYKVLPIDDRSFERIDPATAGRPNLMAGVTSLTLSEGMGSLPENNFLNIKNTSWNIVAEIDIKDVKSSKGMIISQGGYFGGWALYVKEGSLNFTYNFLGIESYTISDTSMLPAGKSTVKMDFAYDGGKPGAGGTVTLYVNEKEVASGRVEQTHCAIFSADETANVGCDRESPIVPGFDYENSIFTDKIDKVTVTLTK